MSHIKNNIEKYFLPPNLRVAKVRGQEEVRVLQFGSLTEELASLGRGKRYLIQTYGCQMNVHDSEMIAGLLEAMSFTPANDDKDANIILLNTCAIRENAEEKVFGVIGSFKHLKLENPDLILGICGCMAQEESVVNRILQTYPYVDLIFGTHNIHRLPHLIKSALYAKEMVVEVWSKEGDIVENMPMVRTDGLKAWINIMYGCDKFCTYCIVPYTRGKERSRLPADVLAELRTLARKGYQDVTLLGQNVNAYGKDFKDKGYTFGHLMDEIRKIGIPRVRFTTSHPRDFDQHLIDVLAKGGNLVEHIHLPVQSGCNEILKLMARKYTREHYLELVQKIRQAIPAVSLTTDIIVGFPGETEAQFLETLSLVEMMEYDLAYTFIYSPRVGTPAAKMKDDVPLDVKKERLQRLNLLQNEISLNKNRLLRGKVAEVLVEGVSKKNEHVLSGRTRTNKIINFAGPKSLIGKITHVQINEALTWSLNGDHVICTQ